MPLQMTLGAMLDLFPGANGEEELCGDAHADVTHGMIMFYPADPSSKNEGINVEVHFELNPDSASWNGSWESDPNKLTITGANRFADSNELEHESYTDLDIGKLETAEGLKALVLAAIEAKTSKE